MPPCCEKNNSSAYYFYKNLKNNDKDTLFYLMNSVELFMNRRISLSESSQEKLDFKTDFEVGYNTISNYLTDLIIEEFKDKKPVTQEVLKNFCKVISNGLRYKRFEKNLSKLPKEGRNLTDKFIEKFKVVSNLAQI